MGDLSPQLRIHKWTDTFPSLFTQHKGYLVYSCLRQFPCLFHAVLVTQWDLRNATLVQLGVFLCWWLTG